jgi:elongation factor 1-delta
VALEGETSGKKDGASKKAPAKKGDSLAGEIEKAREAIEHTLSTSFTSSTTPRDPIASRVEALERENSSLRELLDKLTLRVGNLEQRTIAATGKPVSSSEPAAPVKAAAPAKPAKEDDDDDEEDDDDEDGGLWGSDEDEETEEEKRIREERLAAYNAKKANKKAVIAKSEVTLNCKPWDLETNMKEMENLVRSIEMDGLLWAKSSKLIPVAYGIKMLEIKCVIEDDKVSTDLLVEKITEFEDFVQSCDIGAFSKI